MRAKKNDPCLKILPDVRKIHLKILVFLSEKMTYCIGYWLAYWFYWQGNNLLNLLESSGRRKWDKPILRWSDCMWKDLGVY